MAVGPGVGVGVGVGVAMANVSVQAGAAALGVTCGTVGATGFVVVSLPLVRNTMAAKPMVMILTNNTCQYFLNVFIHLLPHAILKYFRLYGKAGRAGRNRKCNGVFTVTI